LRTGSRSVRIPTVDTNNLKQVLRTKCLPALAGRTTYFSIADVRAWLREGGRACSPALLRGYMSEFMRAGVIHHAGRGWYSRLANPFTLNSEPVANLVQSLSQTFPLVGFSCWSTAQIKGAMHHLLSQFVTFVNVALVKRQSGRI
jgi:hypothetical protein